jgi:hypothetical protein
VNLNAEQPAKKQMRHLMHNDAGEGQQAYDETGNHVDSAFLQCAVDKMV